MDDDAFGILDYIYRVVADGHFESELDFVTGDQGEALMPTIKDGYTSTDVPRDLFDNPPEMQPRQLEYLLEELEERGYIRFRRGPATVHWVRITDEGKLVAQRRLEEAQRASEEV